MAVYRYTRNKCLQCMQLVAYTYIHNCRCKWNCRQLLSLSEALKSLVPSVTEAHRQWQPASVDISCSTRALSVQPWTIHDSCTLSACLECGPNIIAGVLVAIVCLYTQSLKVVGETHMRHCWTWRYIIMVLLHMIVTFPKWNSMSRKDKCCSVWEM